MASQPFRLPVQCIWTIWFCMGIYYWLNENGSKMLPSVWGTLTCHRLWGYLQCGQ